MPESEEPLILNRALQPGEKLGDVISNIADQYAASNQTVKVVISDGGITPNDITFTIPPDGDITQSSSRSGRAVIDAHNIAITSGRTVNTTVKTVAGDRQMTSMPNGDTIYHAASGENFADTQQIIGYAAEGTGLEIKTVHNNTQYVAARDGQVRTPREHAQWKQQQNNPEWIENGRPLQNSTITLKDDIRDAAVIAARNGYPEPLMDYPEFAVKPNGDLSYATSGQLTTAEIDAIKAFAAITGQNITATHNGEETVFTAPQAQGSRTGAESFRTLDISSEKMGLITTQDSIPAVQIKTAGMDGQAAKQLQAHINEQYGVNASVRQSRTQGDAWVVQMSVGDAERVTGMTAGELLRLPKKATGAMGINEVAALGTAPRQAERNRPAGAARQQPEAAPPLNKPTQEFRPAKPENHAGVHRVVTPEMLAQNAVEQARASATTTNKAQPVPGYDGFMVSAPDTGGNTHIIYTGSGTPIEQIQQFAALANEPVQYNDGQVRFTVAPPEMVAQSAVGEARAVALRSGEPQHVPGHDGFTVSAPDATGKTHLTAGHGISIDDIQNFAALAKEPVRYNDSGLQFTASPDTGLSYNPHPDEPLHKSFQNAGDTAKRLGRQVTLEDGGSTYQFSKRDVKYTPPPNSSLKESVRSAQFISKQTGQAVEINYADSGNEHYGRKMKVTPQGELTYPVKGKVETNRSFVDGAKQTAAELGMPLRIEYTGSPAHRDGGVLTVQPDGGFHYEPPANKRGNTGAIIAELSKQLNQPVTGTGEVVVPRGPGEEPIRRTVTLTSDPPSRRPGGTHGSTGYNNPGDEGNVSRNGSGRVKPQESPARSQVTGGRAAPANPVNKEKVMAALDFLTSDRSAPVIEGHKELALELEYVKNALQNVPPDQLVSKLRSPNVAVRVNSIRQATTGGSYVQGDVDYLLKLADRPEIRQHGMLESFEAMRREDLGFLGRLREDYLPSRPSPSAENPPAEPLRTGPSDSNQKGAGDWEPGGTHGKDGWKSPESAVGPLDDNPLPGIPREKPGHQTPQGRAAFNNRTENGSAAGVPPVDATATASSATQAGETSMTGTPGDTHATASPAAPAGEISMTGEPSIHQQREDALGARIAEKGAPPVPGRSDAAGASPSAPAGEAAAAAGVAGAAGGTDASAASQAAGDTGANAGQNPSSEGQTAGAANTGTAENKFDRKPTNHYEALDIELKPGEKPTDKDIYEAYKKASKKYHHDANPDNREAAHERMKQVNEAYETLKDPQARKAYDREHNFHSSPSSTHFSGRTDRAAVGAARGAGGAMNAYAIHGDIVVLKDAIEKGNYKTAAVALADLGANAAGLSDDALAVIKNISPAAAEKIVEAGSKIPGCIPKMSGMTAAGTVASGGAKLLLKSAPVIAVVLETTMESGNFINEDGSMGRKSMRAIGATGGMGVAMGTGAAIGAGLTAAGAGAGAIALAPIAGAVVIGWAASDITSSVISQENDARERFQANVDQKQHLRSKLNNYSVDARNNDRTKDTRFDGLKRLDNEIDWANPEARKKVREKLHEDIARAQDVMDHNHSPTGAALRNVVSLGYWGDPDKYNHANTEKIVCEQALKELDQLEKEMGAVAQAKKNNKSTDGIVKGMQTGTNQELIFERLAQTGLVLADDNGKPAKDANGAYQFNLNTLDTNGDGKLDKTDREHVRGKLADANLNPDKVIEWLAKEHQIKFEGEPSMAERLYRDSVLAGIENNAGAKDALATQAELARNGQLNGADGKPDPDKLRQAALEIAAHEDKNMIDFHKINTIESVLIEQQKGGATAISRANDPVQNGQATQSRQQVTVSAAPKTSTPRPQADASQSAAIAKQKIPEPEKIASQDKTGKLEFVDSFREKMRDVLSGVEGKSSRGDLNGDGKTDRQDVVAAFDKNHDGKLDKGEQKLALEGIRQSQRLRNALGMDADAATAVAETERKLSELSGGEKAIVIGKVAEAMQGMKGHQTQVAQADHNSISAPSGGQGRPTNSQLTAK